MVIFILVFHSSVDGYFVTSSYDRTARLWSTEFVYPLRIFAGHEESVEVRYDVYLL